MSIHHATKKKLAEEAITIQETPEGSTFRFSAFWESESKPAEANIPTPSVELWGDNAKELGDAMIAAKSAVLEYYVSFDQDADTGEITVSTSPPLIIREIGTIEQVGDLPSAIYDVLQELTNEDVGAIQEADAAELEEEDLKGGSVVPDKYKTLYKEAGHPNTCGDWLSDVLGPLTTTPAGKLDPDAMAEVARLNGINTDKLNRTTPGWQGRFRMTARNMLVKVVAKNGFISVPPTDKGDSEKAPSDWLAANQPKVKEAGDKKAARRAKG